MGPARPHTKPIGLLGRDGYWDALLAWLDHAVAEGFLAPEQRPRPSSRLGRKNLEALLEVASIGRVASAPANRPRILRLIFGLRVALRSR